MKHVKRFLTTHGFAVATGIALAVVAAVLFTFGIKSYLPGLSPAEMQAFAQTESAKAILLNPLWLPHKLIDYILHLFGIGPAYFRLTSTVFALASVTAFYYICSRWFKTRTTVLSCCLFTVSSMTLLLGRTGTPAILLYSWLYIAALGLWLRQSHRKLLPPLGLFVVTTAALYTPGTIWFVLLIAMWFWRDAPILLKQTDRRAIYFGSVVSLIMLAPLGYAFYNNSTLLFDWLLLPKHPDWSASYATLRSIPSAFFYQTSIPAAYNVGKLPLFDAFSGTMLLLGLYATSKKIRLQRIAIYCIAALTSTILAALNNNQLYLLFMLPFLYILIAEGIRYMLDQWRNVFPRNPIARFIGTLIMSAAVLFTGSYHMHRYFIAWHNAPETREIYNKKP